ncbi:permease prefix domain 1-containing protein [Clostridium massiliamazoniense]|uniref:permease prefix domain 1-containing protein n=1 Tax=Clostridium massiliamazoniense TaxID=1347366 RepID=UPI0006D83FDD|nr:permease prefix domain 1-containing protein [Clostridium massiliamazoniense]
MSLKEDKVNGYLDNICSLIKNKRVHEEVKSEIKAHLEELERGYERDGKREEEATDLALKSLGNPKEIGKNLNKIHSAKIDFKLIITACFLVIFGFLGVATFDKGQSSIMGNTYLMNNIVYIIIGIIFFIIGLLWDFRKIKKYSIFLYCIALIIEIWSYIRINIPTGRMASSPFMLLVPYMTLFALSGLYIKINWNKKINVAIAIILGLIPLEAMRLDIESLPMYVCYSIVLMTLIYFNSKNKIIIFITGIMEIIIFLGTNLVRKKIIITGYFELNNIFDKAKIIGTGTKVGDLVLGLHYPLVNIIYNYGWLFGVVTILSLLYFTWRIIRIPYLVKSIYGKSISASISIIISVQIIWSILMNLNIVPFVQLSTIFITYSGVEMILNLFLIGLLINIYKGRTLTQ